MRQSVPLKQTIQPVQEFLEQAVQLPIKLVQVYLTGNVMGRKRQQRWGCDLKPDSLDYDEPRILTGASWG